MLRRSSAFNVVIALLTIAIVIGAFASFQRKRSSFERIDFTFERDRGMIVVKAVDANSAAAQAGLRAGDEIWLIAGTPTAEVEGLQKTLRRIGQPVPLLVARQGRTLNITYTPPELKIDYQYLFLSFIGFLYLAIGLFTLFRGERRDSLLFFFVTLLSFIVYVYTPAGDIDRSFITLQLVEDFARIFLPPLTLHFFLLFPRPIVRKNWVIALLYVPALLVAAWDIDLFVFHNSIAVAPPLLSMQVLERWEMAHFAIYFSLAVVAVTYTYRTARAAGQKKQIKWIYLGMSLGFVPFLFLYLIPFLFFRGHTPFATLAILPLAFIPLAFAVSILRYKLWDVEVVIKEILAYTVTFVFGMIAFSAVNLLLSRTMEEGLALERNFLTFTSGLLIAGVLIPVKGRIESVIEMFLYREAYRHRKAMTDFAQELATFHDLHELIAMLGQRLAVAVGIQKMNLYLREGTTLALYGEDPVVPPRVRLNDFGSVPAEGPLVLDRPRLPDGSDLPAMLLKAGYRYAFPLRNHSELQGFLLFGTKRGEESLSRDDIHLLASLTAPVALAIENSRLYTRLRRQLDEIRSLKEYNENIIESSSSAIAVVTVEGTLLTANQAFWDLIGGSADDIDDISSLFPPYRELREAASRSIQTSFVNRDGVSKEVTVTSSALNANDVADGTRVLVAADISDRLRLERELQDKERLASLGLLAAGVAHEVNTPLAGISGYAQLLLADTPQNDPRYSILKKMEQQTFRASNLVNNLLDLAANRPRRREEVEAAELIHATVALHEELLKAKQVHVHITADEPLRLRGNFSDLQQVLTNVLLNARDAVQPGGNIWISADAAGSGRAVIRIRDDGKGIPRELLSRIFEPLVTTKRGQGGTGLGLSIAQRILGAWDGMISVDSEPGRGATFTISLPQSVLAAREN
jgi:two-component system, NtrC family, sensor kinase